MVRNHFPKLMAVGLLLAVAAPAVAQDTTQAQSKPQHHVVKVGDTLWGLAQLYLGDPFLWPEIYRLNTSVVEDPHWIFPGEELLLMPADHTQVAAAPDTTTQVAVAPPVTPVVRDTLTPVTPDTVTPPMRDTLAVQQEAARRPVEVELPTQAPPAPPPAPNTPTIFARTPAAVATTSETFAGSHAVYHGVQAGDFYSATFLTEGKELPWGRVESIADLGTPRRATNATAMIFQDIEIMAPQGAIYQVGDSLLTVEIGRDVGGGWGRVVTPTSLVRVVSASGRSAVARLIQQYDQVQAGQAVMPVEPFPGRGVGRPQPVSGGVEGLVIARADPNPVPNLNDAMFVDLGRNVSIASGDLFEILPPTPPEAGGPQALAEAEVVRVGDRSATLRVTRIFTTGIRAAAKGAVPVRLIAKTGS
jgi:LysM repeat protein